MLTVLFTRAYAPRGGPPLHMRRQSIFGSAKSKTVALDGSSDTAGLMCLRRLAVASAALILGTALLSACQPIPQSYYDWLAAGGGYYDGYAPLYQGRSLNECRLRDTDHPRACRGDSGRVGADGLGAGGVAAFGHPLALSSSGHVSGTTSGSGGRGSGMTGHAATHGGGHASPGGHGGGGHGGHGGR